MEHSAVIENARPFDTVACLDEYLGSEVDVLEGPLLGSATHLDDDVRSFHFVARVDEEVTEVICEVKVSLRDFLFEPAHKTGLLDLVL